jgi:signal transduction histidine kinase
LSQILLQTELTLQKLRTSPETKGDTTEALQNIRSRTEEVVETIETIRALLGNVATGQQELDLANVARSAVLYLQPTLTKKGVELHQEGLASPRTMAGDDAQLHLMVTNLLRNAVQALEKQAPGQKIISLVLAETPEVIRLTVEDSGPGFSPEQKLVTELPIASTKPEGMGMGLYLVCTAVENHRGQISFDRSATLGGAKVQVSFPK